MNNRSFSTTAGVLAALFLVLSSTGHAADAKSREERGKWLVNLGGCHDCHSPKVLGPNGIAVDETKMLSGSPAHAPVPPVPEGVIGMDPGKWAALTNMHLSSWAGPWGISFAANLTPDVETGIGSWTEEMFIRTIRTGKHLGEGRPILPPMPWENFSRLDDEDLKSIFTYLRSLPPVKNAVHEPIPPAEGVAP
jgi:hypothetical protein